MNGADHHHPRRSVEDVDEQLSQRLGRDEGAVLGERLAHGVDDFGAATVVEGNVQRYSGVVCRKPLSLGHSVSKVWVQILRAAYVYDPDILLMKGFCLTGHRLRENIHDAVNFVLRAAPVLS